MRCHPVHRAANRSYAPVLLSALLFALFIPAFGRAADDGHSASSSYHPDQYGPLHDPVLTLSFEDNPDSYLIGLTWDGESYWGLHGGDQVSQLTQYSASGDELAQHDVPAAGFGLVYNPVDRHLHVSTVGGDVLRVDDPVTGAVTLEHEALLLDLTPSLGMSPDGLRLFGQSGGSCQVHDFFSGELLYSVEGLACGADGLSGSSAVAHDGDYIYTWDASDGQLYVQSNAGALVVTMPLAQGSIGYSLSFANHLLFVSDQETADSGTWYGYSLRDWSSNPVVLSLLPTVTDLPPAGGTVTCQVGLSSLLPQTVPGLTFWTRVQLPSGQLTGPVAQVNFVHQPLMNVTVDGPAIPVPPGAPSGVYLVHGHVGFFPQPLLSDAFAFEKHPAAR